MTTTITKYNSVIATLGLPMPAWVTDEDDQVRVAAYDGYLDMYRNVPTTFKVSMRGEDNDKPIYVPSAARIVEAIVRYLGKGWNWTVTSASGNVDDEANAQLALSTIYRNNAVPTKLSGYKRNMVRKGDAVWHVWADMTAPSGQRIHITELDPRTCFRIPNPINPDVTAGWYIVNLLTIGNNTIAMRQEYKITPGGIETKLGFYEQNAWDDRWIGHPPLKPVDPPEAYQDPALQPILAGVLLPSSVKALPIYHAANQREAGEPWGVSDIAGIETLIAGINNGVSDEDVTLALQGLGMYTTTSTRPIDEDGNEVDWIIQPGYVAELKPGTEFNRVEGVKSMVPFQDHLKYLTNAMDESSGLSAVAVGRVDVQIAQSGIALRLDMMPILAKNEEKEAELIQVLDQMGNDLLQMWWPIEQQGPIAADVMVSDTFDDPLPIDRDKTVTEVTALVTAGLMSKEFAVQYLKDKLGYQFPADMLASIQAEADAVGARLAGEIANPAGAAAPADPSLVGG